MPKYISLILALQLIVLNNVGISVRFEYLSEWEGIIDYDLGSEKIIKDIGVIKNGKFVVGERTYDVLVFPSGIENLNS